MKVNMCFESSEDSFHLSLAEDSDFCMEFEASLAPVTEKVYEGPYKVSPGLTEQKLATEQRLCTEDITVLEIPYFEVGNISGMTAIIGGKQNGEF